MANRVQAVPLTAHQQAILKLLTHDREGDGYLAGGAALHFAPNSARYSDDLDFFHDSEARVATAYASDRARLESDGYAVSVEITQPGFIRAIVLRGDDATRVDWAHDSAWRFMPLIRDPVGGLLLHPVDLSVNKMLALAGREEARDFVDILFVHRSVLPVGALIWAAVGKDPGFTPRSLLELLKRRGRYRAEDFARLSLAEPFDLTAAKTTWLTALGDAEEFARSAPPADSGCLYWSTRERAFVLPTLEAISEQQVVAHYGRPGGVLPRIAAP